MTNVLRGRFGVRKFWLGLAWLLAGGPRLFGAETIPAVAPGLPFAEATVTEFNGTVQDVKPDLSSSTQVKLQDLFMAPDMLQTGKKSHAQLTAADGTIARVGSNTVFSFDPASRTINLQQGSLLFNSPPGKGGGTITTKGATATVLGTTLIIVATSDGGFKVLMLEGHGTITFPGGQTVTLTAGQMTFVLPGKMRPDGTRGPSSVGPVLNFDLKAQTAGSELVGGFTTPLPSLPRIEDAVNTQQIQIQVGNLITTTKIILGAVSSSEIVVVDSSSVQTASDTNSDNTMTTPPTTGLSPLELALQTNFTFGAKTIPDGLIFRTPVVFTNVDLGLPSGVITNDALSVTGIIGDTLTAGGTLDLSALDGLQKVTLLGWNGFVFTGSTTIDGLNKTRNLSIYTEVFSFLSPTARAATSTTSGLRIVTNFAAGAPTTFELGSVEEMDLTSAFISSPTGSIQLDSVLGAVNLDGVTVLGGQGDVLVDTLDGGDVNITDNSLLSATQGDVDVVSKGGALTLNNSVLQATPATGPASSLSVPTTTGGSINLEAVQDITVIGGALIANNIYAASSAGDLAINNVNFAQAATISLNARTVSIYNVNFPGSAIVNIASQVGLLAPNPNTNQTPQSGYVNFVSNVNYAGQPAQKFVPISQGGTGQSPTRINIHGM